MQLLLSVGLFSWFLYIVKACSCYGKPHIQSYVCEAEYVIKVEVLAKEEIYSDNNEEPFSSFFNVISRHPDELKYTIKVKQEFKVSPEYEEAAKDTLYTEGTESFCGVNLQVGSMYLITGTLYDGQLRTGLCNLVKKWKTDDNIIDNKHALTRKQIRFFRQGYYLENCDCPVNDCTNMGCYMGPIQGPPRYCLLLEKDHSCYKNASFCRKTKKRGCQWKKNGVVKECLEPPLETS